MKSIYGAIVFAIICPLLHGQIPDESPLEYYYRHFSVKDGLPSNEVYFVEQDHNGYLWLCTDNGVCRFDGSSFRNYGEKEGLCSNVIFGCGEDDHNRMWYYSYTGELSYYEPASDRFVCPAFNDSLSAIVRGLIIQDLVFDSDTIYVVTTGRYIKIVHTPGDSKIVSSYVAPEDAIAVKMLPHNKVVVTMGQLDTEKNIFDVILENGKTVSKSRCAPAFPAGPAISAYRSAKGVVYILVGRKVLTLETPGDKFRVWQVPFSNTPSLHEYNGAIYCGSYNNGLWKLELREGRLNVEQVMEDLNVSCAVPDPQGGLWFSSHTDGLYFIPTSHTYAYDNKKSSRTEKVRRMSNIGDSLFYMNYDGRLNLLRIQNGTPYTEELLDLRPYTADFNPYSHQELYVRAGDPFLYNIRTEKRHYTNQEALRFENEFQPFAHLAGNSLQLEWQTKEFTREIILHKDWKFGRITAFAESGSGKFWIGTIFDLFLADTVNDKVLRVGKENGFHRMYVKCVRPLGGDSVIVGTSQGLYLLRNEELIKSFGIKDGLSSDKILALTKWNGRLCVATSQGIDVIENLKSKGRIKVTSLTGLLGMAPFPVTHLSTVGDFLVAGTEHGVYAVNRQVFESGGWQLSPGIVSFRADEQIYSPVTDGIDLPHDRNSVEIAFHSMNFRNAGNNSFRHRFGGNDSTSWTITKTNMVFFPSLQPGSYNFEVQAKNPDGSWSANTASLEFHVSEPFWAKTWFITICALAFVLLVYLYFLFRLKRMRQISELNAKFAEAKIQALGMQLNPHFVFNALNSVSYSMAKHDVRHTLKFLGKFGKLMRTVFRNSQQVLITVEEELEALKIYMELETARLDKSFSYSVMVQKDIDPNECLVPSLLLQPIVENAIWHGIASLDEPGHIDIVIMERNGLLELSVSDIGVGVHATRAQKMSDKREKHSLDIIRERLSLFGLQYGEKVSLNITANVMRDKNPGTKVTIVLPLLHERELIKATKV